LRCKECGKQLKWVLHRTAIITKVCLNVFSARKNRIYKNSFVTDLIAVSQFKCRKNKTRKINPNNSSTTYNSILISICVLLYYFMAKLTSFLFIEKKFYQV